MQSFKDLIVWQKSHQLVLSVYSVTIDFPEYEMYTLISQIRRCAISIPSNIVEGFKRTGRSKFNFYNYSEASLEELKYQILLSYELKYLTEDKYNQIKNSCDEVGKILNTWIRVSKNNFHT